MAIAVARARTAGTLEQPSDRLPARPCSIAAQPGAGVVPSHVETRRFSP